MNHRRLVMFGVFMSWVLVTLTLDTLYFMRLNSEPVLSAVDPVKDAVPTHEIAPSSAFRVALSLPGAIFLGETNRALLRLENVDGLPMLFCWHLRTPYLLA